MDIWEYMEGYDREFDGEAFDKKIWMYMQEEDFVFSEEFEEYLKGYGIFDIHDFLRKMRNAI